MSQRKQNKLKCRYCDYTTYRFKGKRYGGGQLFRHVIDNHEKEFLLSVGFNGTVYDYLEQRELEEFNVEMRINATAKSEDCIL